MGKVSVQVHAGEQFETSEQTSQGYLGHQDGCLKASGCCPGHYHKAHMMTGEAHGLSRWAQATVSTETVTVRLEQARRGHRLSGLARTGLKYMKLWTHTWTHS